MALFMTVYLVVDVELGEDEGEHPADKDQGKGVEPGTWGRDSCQGHIRVHQFLLLAYFKLLRIFK